MNRRERRAAKKATRKDEQRTARDIGTQGEHLVETEREIVGNYLGGDRTPERVRDLAINALGFVQSLIDKLELVEVKPFALACREGCSWCCNLHVDVTAPEVFLIANDVREGLDGENLARFIGHVRETWERLRTLTIVQRQAARIPCSLLVEGHCSVYSLRPLLCRGHTSIDALRCEEYLATSDIDVVGRVQDRLYATATYHGLRRGLEEHSLTDEPQELTEGLLVALTVPNAVQRWLSGEPIFTRWRHDQDQSAR
jgi:Fe-S-cluster containining protein